MFEDSFESWEKFCNCEILGADVILNCIIIMEGQASGEVGLLLIQIFGLSIGLTGN